MANDLMTLPPNVVQRGLDVAQWNTLCNSLFPGAKPDSVLMAVDYCKARQLDVMKKPCHIVPISVKQANGSYEYRDVIMPGIYELRTTATRTGLYLGHSPIEYGPDIEFAGVIAPEWAQMVIYRWNDAATRPIEFPVRVLFREVVNTKNGKANQRWEKAPVQMMEKCLEAAGLRKAFPDELGGMNTDDEMHGRVIDVEYIEAGASGVRAASDGAAAGGAGERAGRGKPATREPEAVRPNGGEYPAGGTGSHTADQSHAAAADCITGAQKAILEKRLLDARLTTAQLCEEFKIAHIELLPFDLVDSAKSWITRNAAK